MKFLFKFAFLSSSLLLTFVPTRPAGAVPFGFWKGRPTITAITPTSGFMAGQTPVSITGWGYGPGTTVTIDGTTCDSVVITSVSNLTCITREAATYGTAKNVVVTNSNHESATLTAAYTYDSPLTAIAYNATPYVSVYHTPDWALLPSTPAPALLPTGNGNGVGFSNDNAYMAVAHTTSPFLTIYKTSDWSKVTPDANPPDIAQGVGFSPDGTYMAVAHAATPFITVYTISGGTFTKMTTGPAALGGAGWKVSFSPDSALMAVAHTTTPFITVFQTGSTFTKMTSIAAGDLPPSNARDADFSPDGTRLAVSHFNSPYLTMYNTSTWAKIVPGTPPAGSGYGATFNPDGSIVAVAHSVAPCIARYTVGASSLTLITPDPAVVPCANAGQTAYTLRYSPDGALLTMGTAQAASIFNYVAAGMTKPTGAAADPTPPTSGNTFGVAHSRVLHITSISPASGLAAGGTTITLNGYGFLGSPTVTVGGSPCTGVASVKKMTLTCSTPAHAVGAVDIKIVSAGLTAALSAGYTFN